MAALRRRVPPDADVASVPGFRGMQFEHAAQQGAPEDGHSLCCLAVTGIARRRRVSAYIALDSCWPAAMLTS